MFQTCKMGLVTSCRSEDIAPIRRPAAALVKISNQMDLFNNFSACMPQLQLVGRVGDKFLIPATLIRRVEAAERSKSRVGY
jgi:hypothetical protein